VITASSATSVYIQSRLTSSGRLRSEQLLSTAQAYQERRISRCRRDISCFRDRDWYSGIVWLSLSGATHSGRKCDVTFDGVLRRSTTCPRRWHESVTVQVRTNLSNHANSGHAGHWLPTVTARCDGRAGVFEPGCQIRQWDPLAIWCASLCCTADGTFVSLTNPAQPGKECGHT